MAYEIVPYFWKRFTSLMVVQDIHQKVTHAAGVSQEVEHLAKNFKAILDVFPHAQARQMNENLVSDWLNKVREISYDMDDAFDEYNTSFLRLQVQIEGGGNPIANKKEVRFFLPLLFFSEIVALCRHSALIIEKINKDLDALVQEKRVLGLNPVNGSEKQIQVTSLSDDGGICSRVSGKEVLLSGLLSESSHGKNGFHVISIVDTRGIGKTAIAQFAYNNDDVKNNFNARIWIQVADHSDEFRIAKAIFEALGGSTSDLVDPNSLLERIGEIIERNELKFFLVLDDVREEDCNKCKLFYPYLKCGLNGSKILITTCEETVADMMESMDIIIVKESSKEGFWSCENLVETDKKITEGKGLPKLEDPKKGLLQAFLLKYNVLPSMIKLCFSYCAIFLKDYLIEKDKLIRLWMAQGYLGLEQNVEMEIIGERYFDRLEKRSFFETLFRKDDDDKEIKYCKIHDTILEFLVKSSHENSQENAFHPKLMAEQKTSIAETICSEKRLRSLLIGESYSQSDSLDGNDVKMLPGESTWLSTLLGQLTCLRTLMLDGRGIFIEEIPKEIGKLVHLRYVDLSRQKIKVLPEALCELYNLQTLDLTKCEMLENLPQGMGKLINLRHLINCGTRSLRYMPSGIEGLICLRTLNEFIVSGGGPDTKACLDCLKDLNNLRGKLEIRGLGNVTNVKRIEVLKNKRKLISLVLRFDKYGEGESRSKDDEVLEALQPHQDLEELEIEDYRGNPFCSSWMMSLTRLKELILKNWGNCEQLPPLGKLSSLESLHIECMSGVKRVGYEFLGRKNDATSLSSSLDILFPNLKTLAFWKMEKWEEWDFEMTGEGGEENFTIMPRIASLSISSCRQLKALPDSLLKRTTLKKLVIDGCKCLKKLYNKEEGEEYSKICHIPTIEIDKVLY